MGEGEPQQPANLAQERTGPDPMIGRVIADKYRVIAAIAQGGMGRIYRAEQIPIGRAVAIKLLHPTHTEQDPDFAKRFLKEASALGRLKHPNTVTVFDYGHLADEKLYYMVMELVEGRTLSSVLRERGAMEPARALRITFEIARALSEAHHLGLVHRDLKPGNVMIVHTAEGEAVKVLDFGIVKVLEDESQDVTREDRIVGSPRYMAPEQVRQGPIDNRTDIYSLGVMLYEMLSGAPPYRGATAVETFMAHLQEPVPHVSEHSTQEIQPAVDALVRKCMSKQPEDRYSDVEALKLALREVAADLGGMASDEFPRLPTDQVSRSGSHPRGRDETYSSSTTIESPVLLEKRRSRLLIAVPLALFALLFGTVVGLLVLYGMKPAPPPETPVLADVPSPPPEVIPDEVGPASVAPTETTLSLRSVPEGAEIWEGTRLHGKTPLDLPLAASGEAVRVFELRLEGHVPQTFEQGTSAEPVTKELVLEPVPKPKPVAKPVPKPKPDDDLDLLIKR